MILMFYLTPMVTAYMLEDKSYYDFKTNYNRWLTLSPYIHNSNKARIELIFADYAGNYLFLLSLFTDN